MLDSFSIVAPYLKDPVVLVGFLIFIFFLIARIFLQSGIIPPVAKTTGGQIIKLVLHYGFLLGLLLICLAFFYKFRELDLVHTAVSGQSNQEVYRDIAKQISIEANDFAITYPAINPLFDTVQEVKVRIRYPQITGHPEKRVERKINKFLINWSGVNVDHLNEHFDHVANFNVISLESNTLIITYEAGGLYVGAATSATFNKNIVLNLQNGEPFELKDLFRAGYQELLYQLVKARAFCDQEKIRLADDTGPIRDNQDFFLDRGDLVLVYQRREICAGADGPTFVTVEGKVLKPILNPNGPLGYLL